MADMSLESIWQEKYKVVPLQLEKIKQVPQVATGFNTNIDAILKISGKTLKKLLTDNHISAKSLVDTKLNYFEKPTDVLIGITKCFERGIAEEWITEDINIYNWMDKNLGYQRLQMGGQGGIIANVLALLGIQKVIAHTNSHPALQAKQFLGLDNLYGFNEKGELKRARAIKRNSDIPLIHWIIEFDKGDSFTLEGHTFTCPKSNRFIATYDPLNMNLVLNPHFVDYMLHEDVSYLVLSGFHALSSKNNGQKLINNAVSLIKKWKEAHKNLLVHLEIASTQDLAIRKAIATKIAPMANSIGLNERETIDMLQVLGKKALATKIEKATTACNLFDAVLFLKEKMEIPRIQLHMFGLYLTIQDKRFPFTPKQNLNGMMTAATVASAKAYIGHLEKYTDITKTLGSPVAERGLKELEALANKLKKPELAKTGVCAFGDYQISAIPTILVEKPKTLVGMGDTISSISLIAGR